MKNELNNNLKVSNTGLLVPEKYLSLINEVEAMNVNHCGGDNITKLVIPDHLFGLDISIACDVHDLMYMNGGQTKERKQADNIFYQNMKHLIDMSESNRFLRFFRQLKARVYYLGVRLFGGVYFNKK